MFDTSLWRRRMEERALQREMERQRALSQAVEILQKYFANKRVRAVYLTVSILREGEFAPFSDVDVAVEGLEEDYLRTLAELEGVLHRQVDLIELEHCSFRQHILERGLRIL
ncbi:MAG: nucleotidyltransferase domain-containing protein [Armatimonadota bacterium]|nr:nucleotidyltransferase domain-containing protein [bacterium]MDW8322357.1 nucleotidyltransferase domain-containing protein [Armatimonadota bacterium]